MALSLVVIILLNKKNYTYFIAEKTDSMRLEVTCPKTQSLSPCFLHFLMLHIIQIVPV